MIPLTLAIVSALIVEACGERFAIPQLSVIELVRASADSEHRIEEVQGTPVLRLRNRLLPLVSLERLLNLERPDGDERSGRSEEHTSELQSLMRMSYAVFCLKKKYIPYSSYVLPIYLDCLVVLLLLLNQHPSSLSYSSFLISS